MANSNIYTNIRLLWENPSPKSAFSSLDIFLNISNYDFILINAAISIDGVTQNVLFSLCYPTIVNTLGQLFRLDVVNGSTKCYWAQRPLTILSDRISFSDAVQSNVTTNMSVANSACVPVKIYGIKI